MAEATDRAQQQAASAQKLIDEITEKLRKVVHEFAEGEISQEQFQGIYEHYQGQMLLVAQMAAEADMSADENLPSAGETLAIRGRLAAKARGMAIFYYVSGMLLETLGGFDIPVEEAARVLSAIHREVLQGVAAAPRTERFGKEWLLFVPGMFSVAVMFFSHQPASRQIEMITAMHQDFEQANEAALRSGKIDGAKLAYPFQLFVKRSLNEWKGRVIEA
jgi:hypothetical protein